MQADIQRRTLLYAVASPQCLTAKPKFTRSNLSQDPSMCLLHYNHIYACILYNNIIYTYVNEDLPRPAVALLLLLVGEIVTAPLSEMSDLKHSISFMLKAP